jgi:hypothetical protein
LVESVRYIDYVLTTTRPVLIIEAKRHGDSFKLPKTSSARRRFKLGGVLSEDKELKAAILQAQVYAISKGVPICVVTNGTQFVIFRAQNELGVDFWSHEAVVFDSIDDVLSNFLQFYDCLSFESVTHARHLKSIPISSQEKNVGRLYRNVVPRIAAERVRNRNKLFDFIREVIVNVFQDLASSNASEELIEQCYVESARDSGYEQSLRALLKNRPKLREQPLEPLVVGKKDAGKFQADVEKHLAGKAQSEVILLLGGIGVGKTTFIKRFRRVIAKTRIDRDCIWAVVDFNRYSETGGELGEWVRTAITDRIEEDYTDLGFGSYSMLKQAYHGEYERLKRGRLQPIFQRDPQQFDVEFSNELAQFERDPVAHISKLVAAAARQSHRHPFLVFDNADQFDGKIQNDVFMLAHRMSREIGCSLVISLREESYWKNKDFGALSAFHSVLFHVDAPRLKQVIAKRFKYASQLLEEQDPNEYVGTIHAWVKSGEALKVFDLMKQTILGDDDRYIDLLERLSPGEIRRPLEQLARFLVSGHTNVDALLNAVKRGRAIKVGFHEFIKSIALADREVFDERKSDLINLFAVDGTSDSSNLNRLAVLGIILKAKNDVSEVGLGFIRIEQVVSDLGEHGVLPETVMSVVDFMNARRLLETESQARDSASASMFVRATSAARYYLQVLGRQFAYVDLLISSTSICDEASFAIIDRLSEQAEKNQGAWSEDRIARLELRVERVKAFALYLQSEAEHHSAFKDRTVLDADIHSYIDNLRTDLEAEGVEALQSARRILA